MNITPHIIADHTALWFPTQKILSFADLHLGYDEDLFRKGVHLPTSEWQYQRALIGKLIRKYNPQTIILNGDIKHTFGDINEKEWRHTLQLLDLLGEREVIVIKGNHDIALAPIARKRQIKVVDYFVSDDLLFLHGDVLPQESLLSAARTIIIGHEHPAIGLTNGVRTELYKCFLLLPWKNKQLLVQPSTFSLTTGTDVLAHTLLSPFLASLSRARAYVVGEDGVVLDFGQLNKV